MNTQTTTQIAAANPAIAAEVVGFIEEALNTLSVDEFMELGKSIAPAFTQCPAALANGAEKEVHSKRSIQQRRGQTTPKAEPEVTAAKAKKAPKAKPAKAPKATGSKLVLKANKEVRALLTAAAQAAGGTRLSPIGFDNYTAFLNGIALDAEGNATVSLIPVKGNEPVKGKNVKLVVKGGVATVR